MSRQNRRRDEATGKRRGRNRKGAGRRPPPRSGKCGKIAYRDEAEAKAWMTLFARRHQDDGKKVEKRAYPCHICHLWHLTAQDMRT